MFRENVEGLIPGGKIPKRECTVFLQTGKKMTGTMHKMPKLMLMNVFLCFLLLGLRFTVYLIGWLFFWLFTNPSRHLASRFHPSHKSLNYPLVNLQKAIENGHE